jgi:endonuclease-3 related protein
MVGAVLTQNTSWRNVEKAILSLKELGLTTPEAVLGAPEETLSLALRPSGYFNVKRRRLLNLCRGILDYGSGGLNPAILSLPMEALRERLLRIKGVGPETADCVVLYAANLPSFVVDAYTRRVLSRHGFMTGDPPYEEIRLWFMERLEGDASFYNEFHALFVRVGHLFCPPRNPRCHLCPLGSDPSLSL